MRIEMFISFPEGNVRSHGIRDLDSLCSDFGNGLGVYFNVTLAFLIIVGSGKKDSGWSLSKSILSQKVHLLKVPIFREVLFFFFLTLLFFPFPP